MRAIETLWFDEGESHGGRLLVTWAGLQRAYEWRLLVAFSARRVFHGEPFATDPTDPSDPADGRGAFLSHG